MQILIATRNRHKVGEIQEILGSAATCLSLEAFTGTPQIAETGATFADNARLKSEGIAAWAASCASAAGLSYVLADDSGLEVDVLGGAPGVHSARFAAMEVGKQGNSADLDNNAKLLRLMAGVAATHRGARFRCVLALTRIADPAGGRPGEAGTRLFEGRCEGRIDIAPKGVGGFGYDPLFIPEGYASSFAELGEEVKNRISHRAEALGALLKFLRQPM